MREIRIDTYHTAVMMMGGDPDRWAPATRETADHSLPYCVAIALLDGEVTAQSFTQERLQDPAVQGLMRMVKVTEDAALCAQYPESVPSRVSIKTAGGELLSAEVRYPTGHAMNVMSDAEVEKKFRGMFTGSDRAGRGERILETIWKLDQVGDFGREVIGLLTFPASNVDA